MTQKLQRHKDTRTLPNSTTHHLCRAQEAQTHTTSGAAHAIDQKSREGANEEKVHQTEMLKDPLIIVRGEELVAPDPTAFSQWLFGFLGRYLVTVDTNVRRVRVREDGRGDDASKVVREEER